MRLLFVGIVALYTLKWVFRHGYGISNFDATGGSLCNTGAQDTLAGAANAEMFTTLTIVGDTDKSVSVHLFNEAAYEDPRVTAGYICERDSKYFQNTSHLLTRCMWSFEIE